MNVYRAVVAISKAHTYGGAVYYIPAKDIVAAVEIVEKGRYTKYEGEPVQVISIELADGIWIRPK